MRTHHRTGALLLGALLLAGLGCTAVKAKPQALTLEDLQPPDRPEDAALRGQDRVPIPTETSNLRADPQDPRPSAMLEDLTARRPPTYGENEKLPLPEEPKKDDPPAEPRV